MPRLRNLTTRVAVALLLPLLLLLLTVLGEIAFGKAEVEEDAGLDEICGVTLMFEGVNAVEEEEGSSGG